MAIWPALAPVVIPTMLIGPGAEAWLRHSPLNSIPMMRAMNMALAYGLGWAFGRLRAHLRTGWTRR